MLKSKKKIIIFTGGSGRFGSILKKRKFNHKVFFPSKRELNITNIHSIEKYFKKKKTKYSCSYGRIIKTYGNS